MKKLVSLILCMWMALSGSSQNLKPRIQLGSNDTFLCFSLAQSRLLAKELVKGRYCDSMTTANEAKIMQLCQLSQAKDSTIHFLREQVSVQDCALEKSDQIIRQQDQSITTLSSRIKGTRRQRTVLIVCSVLFAVSLALK